MVSQNPSCRYTFRTFSLIGECRAGTNIIIIYNTRQIQQKTVYAVGVRTGNFVFIFVVYLYNFFFFFDSVRLAVRTRWFRNVVNFSSLFVVHTATAEKTMIIIRYSPIPANRSSARPVFYTFGEPRPQTPPLRTRPRVPSPTTGLTVRYTRRACVKSIPPPPSPAHGKIESLARTIFVFFFSYYEIRVGGDTARSLVPPRNERVRYYCKIIIVYHGDDTVLHGIILEREKTKIVRCGCLGPWF